MSKAKTASGAMEQVVKMIVGAGKASPSPPIGPALGSKGVKSMDFCKEFNARTEHLVPGTPTPVAVTVRADRSFTFEVRTPPTSWMMLNTLEEAPTNKKGVRRGANNPGQETVGTISLKHVYEIAKIKQSEMRLSHLPLKSLCKCIVFQARSVGIKVVA